MKEIIRHKIKHNLKRIETSIKWVLFAIISGVVAGGAGTLFYFGMTLVTLIRTKHPWLIFLLPFGGLVIVGCYNLAPLIFISTLITHLFGGSAGREGAALQMGGSIGNGIGKFFRFDDKDKHVMIMCGMSAAFSALFGTPMAAAIASNGNCKCRRHVLYRPCSMCDQFSCRTRSCLSCLVFPTNGFPSIHSRTLAFFLPCSISIRAVLCAGKYCFLCSSAPVRSAL